MTNSDIFLSFTVALVLAWLGTPIFRRVAIRCNALDYPNRHKAHLLPVPLLGGVSIYLAVSATLLYHGSAVVLAGATWISLWGLWDDCKRLPVSAKLLIQIGAVLGATASGIRVQWPVPEWLNLCLTFLWFIGIMNAFNLIDNMDGLCAGIASIGSAFITLLAFCTGDFQIASLGACLAGACAGFLCFNFAPARIFMGDAGSLLIGFLLAVAGIQLRFPDHSPAITWMIPILILGMPIFDTSLVFVSRLRRGSNPFTTPGQDHTSHRLLRLGCPLHRAVLFHYLTGLILGLCALAVLWLGTSEALVLGATTFSLAALAILWFERKAPVLIPSPERETPSLQTNRRLESSFPIDPRSACTPLVPEHARLWSERRH